MKTMGLIAVLCCATLFATPVEASWLDRLEEGRQRRQHIRSMHILERPNRTVHVYGNFVRYRHSQGNSILY